MRRLLLIASIAAVASCDKGRSPREAAAREPIIETTPVRCYVAPDVPAVPGGRAFGFARSGPDVCAARLESFLAEHAERHVLEIVGVEYPGQPESDGTQELIVIHADGGPWPQAKNLVVSALPCSGEQSEPFRGSLCAARVARDNDMNGSLAFLVAVSSHQPGDIPGTQMFLRIDRTDRPDAKAR